MGASASSKFQGVSRLVQGLFTFFSIIFRSLQIRVCKEELPSKPQENTARVMSATSWYKWRRVSRKD